MSTATTAVGSGALAALTIGTDNVAVGRQAGNAVTSGGSNVIIGAGSAPSLTTGSSNIVIGAGATVPLSSTSNYLNIGGAITGTTVSSGTITLNPLINFEAKTQSSGDNSTKLATTAFVQSAVSGGGGGTVTNVAASGSQGVTISGSPITSSGTIAIGLGSITPSSVGATGTVTGSNLSGTNTGDQTITLTGNVTGSGTGSFATTIASSVALAGSPTTTTQSSGDNSTKIATTAFVQAAVGGGGGGVIPYLSIGGLIISSIAGTHTTAGFSISAGGCADLTGAAYISVPSTLSWAASNGNAINGTDASSSTLANSTTYHTFVCTGTSGTGSFVSASLTPTFPSGYNAYSRRIGSFKTTSAGAPIPYTAYETSGGACECILVTQLLDFNTWVTTSGSTVTMSVPSGVHMRWKGRLGTDASGNNYQMLVQGADETLTTPSSLCYIAPGFDLSVSAGQTLMASLERITNTSGQLKISSTYSVGGINMTLVTRGWEDFRRS